MSQYGEVWCTEMVHWGENVAAVVFFDVRAALLAHSAFSEMSWLGPQRGCRIARLPGNAAMDAKHVGDISRVNLDTQEQNMFYVEFYDVRAAAHARAVEKMRLRMAGGEPHSTVSTKNNRINTGLRVPQHKEEPHKAMIVLISGLPNQLVSTSCLQAMLQQAGLTKQILNIEPLPGKECGKALVKLSSPHGASKCISHFSGCRWDSSGAVVTAVVIPESKVDAERLKALGPPPGLLGFSKPLGIDEEVKSRGRSCTDDSTTAGYSEAEVEEE